MADPRLGWFAIGALLGAVLFGWPWHSRFSRYSRRGSNPPPPGRRFNRGGICPNLEPPLRLLREPLLAAPPAPEPPAEALAARPLLEQMARLRHSPHPNPWSQMLTLSGRAAAWLEENPQGQPVRIEPRGCPLPGACSCVEPAPVVVPPGLIVRFEFEVIDEHDQAVASGDAPTLEEAAREGHHYLQQYQQDGPCTLELRRVEVLDSDAIPLPQAGEVEG